MNQAHQSMLHSRVDFINFSSTIITGVGERPAGEGVEKPLLCALVPGYLLAQALREQAALRTKEGDREAWARLPESERFREMLFELTPCQLNPIHHGSGLRLTF